MSTPKKPAKQTAAPETTELDTSKLVRPNDNSLDESTPLGDEAERIASEPTPIADETSAATGITAQAPDTAIAHEDDVQHALSRETQDGKGDEEPGPSDWNGYATEGVEVEGESS
jgi:hypothetical protein